MNIVSSSIMFHITIDWKLRNQEARSYKSCHMISDSGSCKKVWFRNYVMNLGNPIILVGHPKHCAVNPDLIFDNSQELVASRKPKSMKWVCPRRPNYICLDFFWQVDHVVEYDGIKQLVLRVATSPQNVSGRLRLFSFSSG